MTAGIMTRHMTGATTVTTIADRAGNDTPPHHGSIVMTHDVATLTGYMPIQIDTTFFHCSRSPMLIFQGMRVTARSREERSSVTAP